MRRFVVRAWIVAALLGVAGGALARAEDPPAAPRPAWKKGEQQGVATVEGREARFAALVPEGYAPDKPGCALLLVPDEGGKASDLLRAVKPHLGKAPPLVVALEGCADAAAPEGSLAKGLEAVRAQFALADGRLFAVGVGAGGRRLWDEVVARPDEAARLRGIVLVGAGRGTLDAGEKPARPCTVVLVGDPKDAAFAEAGPAAVKSLAEKGWETVVLEHGGGATAPAAEWKQVLGWAEALASGRRAVLASRRLADPPPSPLPAWKKGEQEGTVVVDGQPERFVALVPNGYSPKKPCAAMLLLHGNGGKAASFLQAVKPHLGKAPLLLISLERCDNQQKAEGYAPKYLEALRKVFALDEGNLFALGFSGGGFRLWDDVVCKAEAATQFRGVVLVGSARQNFDPPEKPLPAPTVVLVGDPKDTNFTQTAPAAEKALTEKGWEVVVLEHNGGHSMPAAELKEVFAWIDALATGKKPALATHRLGEGAPGKRK